MNNEIINFIGKGKTFEPPFTLSLGCVIYDKNLRKVLSVGDMTTHFSSYFEDNDKAADAIVSIAEHIVELLNQKWNK